VPIERVRHTAVVHEPVDDLPADHVHVTERAAWRAWLVEHHERGGGVWLVSWRKQTGLPALTYDEAVEEALAVGWIDSRPGRVDDRRTRLWFAPRKAGSGWSRPNKERIARLEAAGRMLPAGARLVEAARADGSWSLLDAVEDLVVPDDLDLALDALPPARDRWDAFPRSTRRAILEWIVQARRPETRAERIRTTAELAQIGERAHQWRPKGR
jgi:uncharacterized protein YdeI (YjbR/CyaY-like superfamily)